jgi:hypothetical protein
MILSAEQCKAHSENCAMLGKEQKISAQRATILLALSRTWNTLAGQTEELEAIASAETTVA